MKVGVIGLGGLRVKVGVIGLGKLGLPVALTLEAHGHDVAGWDISDERRRHITNRTVPEASHEDGLGEMLTKSNMTLRPLEELVEREIVLVCVQTPHEPRFEGCTPLAEDPQDFDYTWLRDAVGNIAVTAADAGTNPLVVIVSTCLPGTFNREIRPVARHLRVAYHPLFIAMGSVVEDYRHPEFVLVGTDSGDMPHELLKLYEPLDYMVPFRCMSITSAELTKVAYNAAIGYKLMLANGVAEIADLVGADCDDVMDTLKCATKRLASPAYMTPGMGDGGGCHPRDQIALSWLAAEHGLSHDPFGFIIKARESHASWLASEWEKEAIDAGLPLIMLGRSYKANSTLTTGSHARLVAHYATKSMDECLVYDTPHDCYPRACYFLATPHDYFLSAEIPPGSVVVDPWGLFPEREGVHIVRPGRRATAVLPA